MKFAVKELSQLLIYILIYSMNIRRLLMLLTRHFYLNYKQTGFAPKMVKF